MIKSAKKRLVAKSGLPPSIRVRLRQLILVALLPLLLLLIGLVFAGYRTDRDHAEQQARIVTHSLALSIEGNLRTRIALLRVLASSRALAAGDLETFRTQTKAVLDREDATGNIVLLREDGQIVMSLKQVPDEPLPIRPNMDSPRRVFATGQPSVSDEFFAPLVHRQIVTIDVPVRRSDDSVALILAMIPSAAAFDTLIQQFHSPSVWTIAVYDRQGVIIARAPNSDRFIGKHISPSFLPLTQANDDGVAEITTLEGKSALIAWKRLDLSGWGVGVAIPRAAFYAPLWRTLAITIVIFGFTLAAALALAALVATRIATPIRALAHLGSVRLIETGNVASLGLREADAAAAMLIAATRERADAEAVLADLNRHLEERVCKEVAAREDAERLAAHAQRMQALGQLAGGIAHDFNNLLQAVQGAAELIDRRATDPVSVKRFARTVNDAAERGAAITRRLLAFARRGDLRAERIDLVGLLNGLRDVLAQTLGTPIVVRVKGASGLPAVMADRGQLETTLLNLATNARDAMVDGGALTLAVAAEEVCAGQLHNAGLKPGQYIRLTVTDEGAGMDRVTLERSLEPFFTTKPQDKGTGLGLSMAKGFAEQSGGALAIESVPGQGTTVTIWLPVANEETKAVEPQPGPALVAGLPRRVLVVDDDDVVREMLVASLDDAGFAVLGAASGAEALALLHAGEPVDALVSDLSMPGMGGLVLIREAQVRRPGLPAVLLTGYAGDATRLAVGSAPPADFSLLRKPVSIAQLVDRIERVLTPVG